MAPRIAFTGADDIVQAYTLAPAELSFYHEHGYLVLSHLLRPDTVAALRRETLALAGNAATPSKLTQTSRYLRGSQVDHLVNSTRLAGLATALLGGPALLYLPFTAVKSASGGGRFEFHQDNQYTRLDGPAVNIWCALNDMYPDNGCLYVVPGSHRYGTLESIGSADGDGHRRVMQEPVAPLPIRLHAGDAVAFSRLTVHGSSHNHTPEPRVAYAVQYFREGVKARRENDQWIDLRERPSYSCNPLDADDPEWKGAPPRGE